MTSDEASEARMRTRHLQRAETPGDPFCISNITETLEQKTTACSRTPMGQETDKSPARTHRIISYIFCSEVTEGHYDRMIVNILNGLMIGNDQELIASAL